MNQRILPLSMMISAAIAIPSLATAAPVNQAAVTPADMRTAPAQNTLQQQVMDEDGELMATQPGRVEMDEDVDANANMTMDAEMDSDMAVNEMPMAKPAQMQMAAQANAQPAAADQAAQARIDAERQAMTQQQTMARQQAMTQNNDSRLAGEAQQGNVTPADQRSTPAPITLQEKKKDKRGELLATQPGEVEFNEMRRFSVR